MRRFFRQTILFTLVIFIGYSSLIFIFHLSGKKLPNLNQNALKRDHLFLRLNDLETYDKVDILFTGSSHAYRGFDTREFNEAGFTSFNLGSSAQTPKQTQLLLNEYLEKLSPKLVVLEVSPMYLSYEGMESTLDFIRNGHKRSLRLKSTWDDLNMLSFNSLLVKEISCLTLIGEEGLSLSSKDTYIKGGYVEKTIRYHSPFKYQPKSKNEGLVEDQKEVLLEILQGLSKKKINYILIEAPVTKKFYNQYDRSAFEAFMKEKPYVNFNQIMNLNDSLNFYDSHHMNVTGVKVFNDLVLSKIQVLID